MILPTKSRTESHTRKLGMYGSTLTVLYIAMVEQTELYAHKLVVHVYHTIQYI